MIAVEEIVEIVRALPEEAQAEVRDFARFLSASRGKPKRTKLRLDWAGALGDLKDRYTSVELQHKINEWRIAKGLSRH